jgi:carbonic anhydrase
VLPTEKCVNFPLPGCSDLDHLAWNSMNRSHRADVAFTYATQDQWRVQFPNYCAGMQQSPINIKLDTCQTTTARLTFLGFTEVPTKTTLKKTIDTVQIWNEYTGPRPTVTGGPLGDAIYVFYQAHFHWGATKT